jgi:phosphate-selective porin OprO/OprP
MQEVRPEARGIWITLLLVALMNVGSSLARAQPLPPAGNPDPAPASDREALLEERLRKLEQMNQKILQQYEEMERKHNARYEKLSQDFRALQDRLKSDAGSRESGSGSNGNFGAPGAASSAPPGGPIPGGMDGPDDQEPYGPEGTIGRDSFGLDEPAPAGTAPGTSGRPRPREPIGSQAARGPQGTISRTRESGEDRGVRTSVGRGLRFTSDDDEFQLIFHNLTQAEFRGFPNNPNDSPLKSQFFIPRQRWYFQGRATKDVEFYTVINRGYGSIDLLDAFIGLNYFGPKLVFRAGRTKTPVSYEYYQMAEGDLVAPERSVYTGNLSGNRQNGFMIHGRILEDRSEYAIGVFNGPRRSFQDFNNDKDVFLYFNVRPFEKTGWPLLQIMNIGGEWDYGNEHNPLQPNIFTTANDQSSTTSDVVVASLSPEFFAFNSNVVENGPRQHTAAWIAWFYKSFNVLAQLDTGFQDYSIGNSGYRTHVLQSGYFVQAYYFLTGEQIKRRVDVTPNRDFSIRNGRITGPGAIEIHTRYATLDIGHDAFTRGLADPNLWTNSVYVLDSGVNWYPNRYTKVYFDWQHSVFGQQVFDGAGHFHKTADLIWLRFQLFF